jgi:hypothetical protein
VSGLIVPGDLPDRKKKREKDFASGQIVPGDLPDDKMREISLVVYLFQMTCPWSKCSRRPACGQIVPGDLPDDKMRGNSQVVKLFQETCPKIKKNTEGDFFFFSFFLKIIKIFQRWSYCNG